MVAELLDCSINAIYFGLLIILYNCNVITIE